MPRSKVSGSKIKLAFLRDGFLFHKEFMDALAQVSPEKKLDALVAIAPFFLEKLGTPRKREEKETRNIRPLLDVGTAPVSDSTAAELSKLLAGLDAQEDDED